MDLIDFVAWAVFVFLIVLVWGIDTGKFRDYYIVKKIEIREKNLELRRQQSDFP